MAESCNKQAWGFTEAGGGGGLGRRGKGEQIRMMWNRAASKTSALDNLSVLGKSLKGQWTGMSKGPKAEISLA